MRRGKYTRGGGNTYRVKRNNIEEVLKVNDNDKKPEVEERFHGLRMAGERLKGWRGI